MKHLACLALSLAACGQLDPAEVPGPDAGAVTITPTTAARTISTSVAIDSGPLLGYASGDLVVFKGVPYAAPPLGTLRFAPPAAPATWTVPRWAFFDPPQCPQKGTYGVAGNEDCLTVNVWTHPDADRRPVLVFVHGGSGISGNHYDASNLARATGAVIVTVQYRLGALGHLALPELDATGGGNFALLDQQAALRWVQRNAAVFGGDPTHVMLFGESEGGHYTCAHTLAPESRGLFSSALAESGHCNDMPDRAATYSTWQGDVVTAVGCTTGDRIACLRAVPAAQLVSGMNQPYMKLVVDGSHLPLHAIDAWRTGAFAHVPLIVGSNRDEANLWLVGYAITYWWLDGLVNSEAGYTLIVRTLFPAQAPLLLSMYPYASYGGGFAALDAMMTDISFSCPMRGWARAVASAGGTVWQYEFTDALQGGYSSVGVPHAFELMWVFGLWSWMPGYTPDAEELALSSYMQSAWGGLAATGAAPSEWPLYSLGSDSHYELGPMRGARSGFRGGRCDALVAAGIVPPSL